ncbi:hypothetical protein RchiOBHm_Chr4g0415901 [Rosa chinensis]|uniref:Uncharacterized protein n=1 Tax=Rosa chinensis TaxID=74649 RepID=A0A2P6QWN3_ROSCH|nr:hypothetical protein RchiOBHm_Chr4g0415901 [Rosa chinensis]
MFILLFFEVAGLSPRICKLFVKDLGPINFSFVFGRAERMFFFFF